MVTVLVDVAICPKPSRRIRVLAEHPLELLAREDVQAVVLPHHHLAPPGGFYDLAIIDADRYPDSATLRRMLHRLIPLAHGGSLVALSSNQALWLAPIAQRFVESHEGSRYLRVDASDGDLVIMSDLVVGVTDNVAPGRDAGQGDNPADRAEALVRSRAHQPLAVAVGELIGAPAEAPGVVKPRYVELGGAALGVEQVRYNRGLESWWNKPLELLPTKIERFRDVRWFRANGFNRSLLVTEGAMLPSSFRWRYGYGPNAVHDATTSGATFIFDEKGRRQPLSTASCTRSERCVREPLLLLGHIDARFGHALLEGLSRAWATPWAIDRNMRVLAWWDGELRPFQQRLFDLLGLSPDRIEVPQSGTLYSELMVPSDGFRLMSSVAPVVAAGWRRIAAAAAANAGTPPARPERRVFLSRRQQARRLLGNTEAFEQLFAARDFKVVCPETLPFDEQVRLIDGAELVASCYGSQLHLSVFMRPGTRKLVVAREHFNGPEETLIAQANGSEASYYFEPQERKGYLRSNETPWTVDLGRFEAALDRWISGTD